MIRSMLVGTIIDGRHSGIDKYLLGFCEAAKDAGVRLDFLTNEIYPPLREQLAGYGFSLIETPSLKHPLRQYRAVKRLLRGGSYDSVYLNLSEAFNATLLFAAAACKVPHRIVHSHNSGVDRTSALSRFLRGVLHKLFRPVLSRLATRRLACSTLAGKWMYDKPFEIVCNSVDGKRFAFDGEVRERMRREMGLEDRRVFLHVGNFNYAKNHAFLLPVMEEILSRDKSAILLLVGDGGTRPGLEEAAAARGLAEYVRFLGIRSDVAALLCAADGFLFPSRIEGFPITCLEAQFSGVPCLLSDTIAPETKIAQNTRFLKTDDPALWAREALAITDGERKSAALFPESASFEAANNKKQLLAILREEAL